MSEPAMAAAAPAAAVVTPASPERKEQVETLVKGILQHMEYPARLELKDMPDGGIGIALHFEGELPGITVGKQRSWLVDCIQFLVNKAINRPNVEKRWVSLGVNAFPEPRPERPEKPPKQAADPQPKASAPAAQPTTPASGAKKAQGKPEGAPPPKKEQPEQRPRRGSEADERALEVKEDPALAKLFSTLAEKAAKTGRLYAVMSLSQEDRARALKATGGVKGVSVKTEGEGHWRRVTFTPDKVVPMPSKKMVMPDYDDEEE
jgi:predicted RNA-binding protein Jag